MEDFRGKSRCRDSEFNLFRQLVPLSGFREPCQLSDQRAHCRETGQLERVAAWTKVSVGGSCWVSVWAVWRDYCLWSSRRDLCPCLYLFWEAYSVVFEVERWESLTKAISRCLGTSFPVQCQRIKGAETRWWSDLQGAPRCSAFASPEGPGTGVSWWIAGSEARSVCVQIVAFIQVDSLYCWRWSVADGGKITVVTLVLWWEASYSFPETSFGSSTCAISRCVDETCWCVDDDHCPEEVLSDHWHQPIAKRVKKTCASCQRQDAAACSQPMAPLPPESESCSTFRSKWTGSGWTTLLLPPASQEVLGFVIYIWRGSSCTSSACGIFIHSGNNSSHTEVICSEGSSWDHLFR